MPSHQTLWNVNGGIKKIVCFDIGQVCSKRSFQCVWAWSHMHESVCTSDSVLSYLSLQFWLIVKLSKKRTELMWHRIIAWNWYYCRQMLGYKPYNTEKATSKWTLVCAVCDSPLFVLQWKVSTDLLPVSKVQCLFSKVDNSEVKFNIFMEISHQLKCLPAIQAWCLKENAPCW